MRGLSCVQRNLLDQGALQSFSMEIMLIYQKGKLDHDKDTPIIKRALLSINWNRVRFVAYGFFWFRQSV
jgi:hypothetical protein